MRIVPAISSRLMINSPDSHSGMKLWPAPVIRNLWALRTSAANSSSLCGRATCPLAVTLPDQLLQLISLSQRGEAVVARKVSQD
jgi:hypothetical protein